MSTLNYWRGKWLNYPYGWEPSTTKKISSKRIHFSSYKPLILNLINLKSQDFYSIETEFSNIKLFEKYSILHQIELISTMKTSRATKNQPKCSSLQSGEVRKWIMFPERQCLSICHELIHTKFFSLVLWLVTIFLSKSLKQPVWSLLYAFNEPLDMITQNLWKENIY